MKITLSTEELLIGFIIVFLAFATFKGCQYDHEENLIKLQNKEQTK